MKKTAKKPKTILRSELQRLAFCNSDRLLKPILLDGQRLQWVGFGFVNEGDPHGDEVEVIDDE